MLMNPRALRGSSWAFHLMQSESVRCSKWECSSSTALSVRTNYVTLAFEMINLKSWFLSL